MRLSLVRVLAQSMAVAGLIIGAAGFSHAESAAGPLYKAKCAACHGVDGKGEVPVGKKLGAKDLTSTEVQAHSDVELTEVVTKGRKKMPPYDGKLTKEQIAELIEHIRGLSKKL